MAMDTKVSAPRGRVTRLDLCTDQRFTSDGSGSFSYTPISPVMEDVGPALEDLIIHADAKELESGLAFSVMIDRSFDGYTWTQGGTAVLAAQTADGYYISSAFSTRTDMGRFMRLSLGLDDAGAAKSARLSISVYLKFLSR